jgi:leucyl/phenylalanyl-tRNA--protein transferase
MSWFNELFKVRYELEFPDPNNCFEYNGLIAFGGDLSPNRLLFAYRNGIFPWFNEGEPIMWWSPNPRPVFYPEEFKPKKSLAKRIRNSGFYVKFDTNFEKVINLASKTRKNNGKETWLSKEMIEAYTELHYMGYAHSVETYNSEGNLVGGLYGLSLGKLFFGESMFSIEKDASKIAFAKLIEFAKKYNFDFIDAQAESDHIMNLGATLIPREKFLKDVKNNINSQDTILGNWTKLI